jgi:hypothetical protein
MVVELATWLVRGAGIYLLAGLLFGIPFILRGAGTIDPVAREGTRGFRLIILPGVLVFWPLLARRWLSGSKHPPTECNAHRRAAQ